MGYKREIKIASYRRSLDSQVQEKTGSLNAVVQGLGALLVPFFMPPPYPDHFSLNNHFLNDAFFNFPYPHQTKLNSPSFTLSSCFLFIIYYTSHNCNQIFICGYLCYACLPPLVCKLSEDRGDDVFFVSHCFPSFGHIVCAQ